MQVADGFFLHGRNNLDRSSATDDCFSDPSGFDQFFLGSPCWRPTCWAGTFLRFGDRARQHPRYVLRASRHYQSTHARHLDSTNSVYSVEALVAVRRSFVGSDTVRHYFPLYRRQKGLDVYPRTVPGIAPWMDWLVCRGVTCTIWGATWISPSKALQTTKLTKYRVKGWIPCIVPSLHWMGIWDKWWSSCYNKEVGWSKSDLQLL